MPKSDTLGYLQEKKLGPADELREHLHKLEESHLNIKTMDSAQALALLRDLDWVVARLDQLEANGLDLRPERGRFQAIQGHLKKKAAPLLQALGGPMALRKQRPAPLPPPEQWWWYINDMVAAQQQRLWRRVVIGLAMGLLVIGGVIIAFNTILAPSPETVARLNAENDASSFVEEGKYLEALAALENGLAKVPGDSGLLIFKGVVLEALGQEEEAAQTFAQAQELITDPKEFYLARAQLYLRMNQPEKAEREALAALELDEEFGRTWLTLGQAYELQGRVLEALETYETAGQVAFDQNENEVYVLSRMALARLSQSPPDLPVEEATEESGN
ncbi:MAG: tetratricopeptide repeat protein [Anaerolineae bacterium]|nr:tetratricopeptide repeat protein [Anaerolineae bacterium]